MKFYIGNIPYEADYKKVYSLFRPHLVRFTCDKQRGKGFAILTVYNEEESRRFLAQFGPRSRNPVILGGRRLKIEVYQRSSPSNDRDLAQLYSHLQVNDQEDDDDDDDIIIKMKYLEMGMWTSSLMDSRDGVLGDSYFSSEWNNISDLWPYPEFSISNSKRAIEIIIDEHIVHIPFGIVEPNGISLSKPRHIHNRLELFIELCQPPEFRYRQNPLFSLLNNTNNTNTNRTPGIPGSHQRLSGICLVYKCTFDNINNNPKFDEVWKVLAKHELMDSNLPTYDIRTVMASHYAPQHVLRATIMMRGLPIQVAFQVQAMISSGYMFPSEASDPEFSEVIRNSLANHSVIAVAEAIRQLGNSVKISHDPYKSEEIDGVKIIGNRPNFPLFFLTLLAENLRPLHAAGHVILVNHVYVTPAGYILSGPVAERSNRVVRYYKRYSDNFLRVSFTDEDGNKMGFEYGVSLNSLYENRFSSALKDGIRVAGRTFEFLAFSNSSLRDHSCWFFAPSESEFYQGPTVTVEVIRGWMGDFSQIRCPARYASRMGQCFTSTVHAVHIEEHQLKKIRDIERGNHCFSDGIGTISRSLARHAWISATSDKNPLMVPSIFQIRIGGAKGVVSVDPNLEGKVVCLRPSMIKFDATNSSDLEIAKPVIRWQVGYLNRPLIMLLEHLGVENRIFLKWQRLAVKEVNDSISSKKKARKLVKRFSGRSHIGTVLIGCWKAGLDINEYPLLTECLETLRKYALKMLQQRARIPLPHSFMLMGVLDETNTLKAGEVYICLKDWHRLQNGVDINESEDHLSYTDDDNYDDIEEEVDSERVVSFRRVLTGRVLVTRSPALHPGDVQMFTAVLCDNLNHLQNCIVFSQQGQRPGPNMLSGGDLDGDEFFVSLNSDLLFPHQNLNQPADYPRVDPINLDRPVNISDVADFFLGFMQNDQLGRIANMHLALADQSSKGPSDENCLRLAELHSTAVDYPKTGHKPDLSKIGRIEHFPDFMSGAKSTGQRRNRGRRVYDSQKALGILYRDIEQEEEESDSALGQEQGRYRRRNGPSLSSVQRPHTDKFWEQISKLEAAAGWRKHLREARQSCISFHNELRRIMTTQSPSRTKGLTESEALTGCLVRDRHTRGKRNYDIQNGITDAVTLLVNNFRERLTPSTENDEPLSSAESTSNGEFEGGEHYDDDDDDDDLVLYVGHQDDDDDDNEDDGRELDEEDYDELWLRLRTERRQMQLREAENSDIAIERAVAWYYVGAVEPSNDPLTSFAWVASDVLFRALREDKRRGG